MAVPCIALYVTNKPWFHLITRAKSKLFWVLEIYVSAIYSKICRHKKIIKSFLLCASGPSLIFHITAKVYEKWITLLHLFLTRNHITICIEWCQGDFVMSGQSPILKLLSVHQWRWTNTCKKKKKTSPVKKIERYMMLSQCWVQDS